MIPTDSLKFTEARPKLSELLDRQRADRFTALERIGEKFADVPDDELEEQIARAIAAVRAQQVTAPAR